MSCLGNGGCRSASHLMMAAAAVSLMFSAPALGQQSTNFEKEWAALAEAAKKEGRLLISLSRMPDYQPLLDAFSRQFGVRVQTQLGSGSARVTRVLAERSAGKFTVDVGLVSVAASTRRLNPAGALEDMPSLLFHPDVVDTSKWHGKRHWYVDEGSTKNVFVHAARALNSWTFWYNTEKLSAADVASLKSPKDFLDPKWKGMMADQAWGDPGRVGGLMEVYFAPDGGPEWVRKYLTEMDVAFTSDSRLEETWLVRGRNPLKWNEGNIAVNLVDLANKGLPIKRMLIDKAQGVLEARSSECCVMVFKNAPNPNAAKLFVNWFLTAETQAAMNALTPAQSLTSLREDVSPGNTDTAIRRIPGKDYSFRDFDEHYRANLEEARAFVVKHFNERNQR